MNATTQQILKLENDFANDPEVQKLISILTDKMIKMIDEAGLEDSAETDEAWDEFHEGERYLDLDEMSMFRFLLRY